MRSFHSLLIKLPYWIVNFGSPGSSNFPTSNSGLKGDVECRECGKSEFRGIMGCIKTGQNFLNKRGAKNGT